MNESSEMKGLYSLPAVDHQEAITTPGGETARPEGDAPILDADTAEGPRGVTTAGRQAEPEADRPIVPSPAGLADRDAMVDSLLDQVYSLERIEAAHQAEWEHLRLWLEGVPLRVGDRNLQEIGIRPASQAERRRAEAQEAANDAERMAGQAQRRTLEEEIERLRARLSEVTKQTDGKVNAAVAALYEENRSLHATFDKLARDSAAELKSAHHELELVRAHINQARSESYRLHQDEPSNERNDHPVIPEAVEVSVPPELPIPPENRSEAMSETSGESSAPISLDEQVLALRQQLLEDLQREKEDRSRRRFSLRLSRLWGR